MSDQPEAPEVPALDFASLGYQVDADHDLYIELTNPNGQVVRSVKLPAPLNKNAAAPMMIQIALAHADGCARTIQTVPIPPY